MSRTRQLGGRGGRPRPPRGAAGPSRWAGSFSLSGALHAALVAVSFAVPLVALRGERAQRLPSVATLSRPPVRVVPLEWSDEREPEREIAPGDEELPEPELRSKPLPEPEEPDPAPPPAESPRAFPADAAFARSAPAFARTIVPEPPEPEEPEPPEPPEPEPDDPVPLEEPDAQELAVADDAPPKKPGVETDESAPEALVSPKPDYPMLAQRMGWEGVVRCRVTVDVDGTVAAVVLERSSGHEALDRAALDALRRWRFRPGTRGGRPAVLDVPQEIRFRLEP